MNRIEMYASSSQLRTGLHRVLAVSHALTHGLPVGETTAWWHSLEADEQAPAREHTLPLDALARVYARSTTRASLDAARREMAMLTLDHDAVQAAFRGAIINGRAHRAHMGRDIYGSTNKRLWDLTCGEFGTKVADRFGAGLGDTAMRRSDGGPSTAVLDALRSLIEFDTSPAGADHEVCVAWLSERMVHLGFELEVRVRDGGRPLVIGRRAACGLAGHAVLYGHYDVTAPGALDAWTHPPRALTIADGRLWAGGVADNKGPLAARLAALAEIEHAPALTWLIQGEEETGSPVAHALLPEVMAELRPTIWLDETGYHDHEDGTLRLLARTMGASGTSAPPDAELAELLRALCGLASRWGVGARHEVRGLTKNVVAGGCPFNTNLPAGARYLAVGVNDSRARIHAPNESIPTWTFPLHAAELDVIFRWVDRTARSLT